jgi:hypothetical protein
MRERFLRKNTFPKNQAFSGEILLILWTLREVKVFAVST